MGERHLSVWSALGGSSVCGNGFDAGGSQVFCVLAEDAGCRDGSVVGVAHMQDSGATGVGVCEAS